MKSFFCIDLQRFMLIPTKFPLSRGMAKFGKFTLRKTLPVMAAYHAKA